MEQKMQETNVSQAQGVKGSMPKEAGKKARKEMKLEEKKQSYQKRLKALPKYFQDMTKKWKDEFSTETCLEVAENAVTIVKKLKTKDEIRKLGRNEKFLYSIGVKGDRPGISAGEALKYLEHLEKNNIDVKTELVLENNDKPLYQGKKVVIPGTKKVVKDGYRNKFIAELIISHGVEKIGYGALEDNILTKVDIPSSVKEIDSIAFAGNPLTELVLHDGLEIIGNYAFAGTDLGKVNIPKSVMVIEHHAFSDTPLKELTLNYGLKEIDNGAFEGTLLTKADIPGSVVKIGHSAFYDTALEEVNLHEGGSLNAIYEVHEPYPSLFEELILKERGSLNAIGPRAFAKTKLRKINIPGDYSIIYDQAFADTPLEEIVFNEGVKYIGSRVIKNTNVKEVRVPESVLAIEADAFKDSSIEKLYLPKKFQEKNGVTIYPKCCKSLSLPWDCEVIYY